MTVIMFTHKTDVGSRYCFPTGSDYINRPDVQSQTGNSSRTTLFALQKPEVFTPVVQRH